MQNIKICTLFQTDNIGEKCDELKIHGGAISFFRRELKSFEFYEKIENNKKNWTLIFFKNEKYEIKYNVSFFEKNIEGLEDKAAYEKMKMERNQIFPISTMIYCESDLINSLEKISSRLKGGKSSINKDDFIELKNSKIFIDPKSVVYFNNIGYLNDQSFQRFIIIYVLGLAYMDVLNKFVNELAILDINNNKKIRDLVKNVALFNAKYFYIKPIFDSSVELNCFWSEIFKKFELQERNDELIKQVQFLHDIIEIENKSAEERSRDLNKKADEFKVQLLSLLSVAATFASLPGLTENIVSSINGKIDSLFLSYFIIIILMIILSYLLSKVLSYKK